MLKHLRRFHDEFLLKWKPIHLCWLFNRMGWKIPRYFIGTTPVITQTHFEFGDNDNSTADNCTFDTEDADRVDGEGGNQVSDVPFMVRIQINESAGANLPTQSYSLWYDTDGTPATATQVTTTSGTVQLYNGLPTDGASITPHMTSPGGSPINGYYHDTSDLTSAFQISKNNYSELQWCVNISSAGEGNTYHFFVRQGSTPIVLDAYNQTPRITIEGPSSSSSSRSSSSSSSRSSSSSSSSLSSSSSSSSLSSSSSSSSLSSSSSSSRSSSSSSSLSSSSSSSTTFELYSRGAPAAMPTDNDNDLATAFSQQDYVDVATEDAAYVDQYAATGFTAFLMKNKGQGQNAVLVTWVGQTDRLPSKSTVYLQVFNRTLTQWETLDSDNLTGAGLDFTLQGYISSSLGDYYDADNWLSCRIWQEVA